MALFMRQCVDAYIVLAGGPENANLRSVQTPFAVVEQPRGDAGHSQFLQPDELDAQSGETPGELASIDCSVLLKVLYGARQARWDMRKAI